MEVDQQQMSMERIEIYASRKKSFLLLAGSLGFVAGSVWMFLHAEEMHRNPLLIEGIAIMGIFFFGLGILVAIRMLLSKQLILVIDSRGLGVNVRKSDDEYIPWSEIIGFQEIKIRQVRLIVIVVNDPQKWVEKEKNLFRRKVMQVNMTNYGSPFNISATGLDLNHEKLMTELKRYHQKYS